MALGDYKNAIKDLTKALEIDEFYTKARKRLYLGRAKTKI